MSMVPVDTSVQSFHGLVVDVSRRNPTAKLLPTNPSLSASPAWLDPEKCWDWPGKCTGYRKRMLFWHWNSWFYQFPSESSSRRNNQPLKKAQFEATCCLWPRGLLEQSSQFLHLSAENQKLHQPSNLATHRGQNHPKDLTLGHVWKTPKSQWSQCLKPFYRYSC